MTHRKVATLLCDDPHLAGAALGKRGAEFHLQEASVEPMDPRMSSTHPTVVLIEHCSDCVFCQESCPNLKIDAERRTMILNETACKGCGICISACPTGAMQQRNSWFGVLRERVSKVLGSEGPAPTACNECHLRMGGGLVDTATLHRPAVRLMCSGRAEPGAILDALASGCDGVFVCGCLHEADFFVKNEAPLMSRREMLEHLLGLLRLPERHVRFDLRRLSDDGCGGGLEAFVSEMAATCGGSGRKATKGGG